MNIPQLLLYNYKTITFIINFATNIIQLIIIISKITIINENKATMQYWVWDMFAYSARETFGRQVRE